MKLRKLQTLGYLLALLLLASPLSAEESEQSEDDGVVATTTKSKIPKIKAASPSLGLQNRARAAAGVTGNANDGSDGANGGSAANGNTTNTNATAGSATTPAPGSNTSSATSIKAGAKPRKTLPPFDSNVLIHIDYDSAEIKDVIKDFAEKTGRNFLIDPKISGKVTIIAPKPVSIDEAYEAFLAALDASGFTTVVEARFSKGKFKGKPDSDVLQATFNRMK